MTAIEHLAHDLTGFGLLFIGAILMVWGFFLGFREWRQERPTVRSVCCSYRWMMALSMVWSLGAFFALAAFRVLIKPEGVPWWGVLFVASMVAPIVWTFRLWIDDTYGGPRGTD